MEPDEDEDRDYGKCPMCDEPELVGGCCDYCGYGRYDDD